MYETLIMDAHVHIYPQFDMERAIEKSLANFILSQRTSENRDDAIKLWLLTERSDCDFFAQAAGNQYGAYRIKPGSEPECLIITDASTHEPLIYVFAGRQIVTTENLEICALLTTFNQPDRILDTMDTIKAVQEEGGIPALNWAPGKWFGARKRVVQRCFETLPAQELFISDTTMRPTFWTTPVLMAAAQQQGFRALYGSDPLPFDREEDVIATYATLFSGEWDDTQPALSMRNMLNDPDTSFTVCGRRSGPISFAKRQYNIMNEN